MLAVAMPLIDASCAHVWGFGMTDREIFPPETRHIPDAPGAIVKCARFAARDALEEAVRGNIRSDLMLANDCNCYTPVGQSPAYFSVCLF